MPLPGDAAHKVGTRFEVRWTVLMIAEVMSEEAESIRLDPPDATKDAIEFWLQRGGARFYYQVKRQRGSQAHWTIGDLQREGVLASFWRHLQNPETQCVFVSQDSVQGLPNLAEHARSAASWDEFRLHFIRANAQAEPFFRLARDIWKCTETDAFQALRRIHFRSVDETTLKEQVELKLSILIEGSLQQAWSVLATFALDHVHAELSTADIWKHVESLGFNRRRWERDPRLLAAVNNATVRYVERIKPHQSALAIIPRSEATQIVDELRNPTGCHTILVSGEAGAGKSVILVQAIEQLRAEGWPVLALRVDRLSPHQTPDAVGQELGLPGSPAAVAGGIASSTNALLVIDQLDAVSLVSGRNPSFYACMHEIIRSARTHPKIRVLIACRAFDLSHDDRFRHLSSIHGTKAISVGHLTPEVVREVLRTHAFNPDSLSERQLKLLTLPLHLELFVEAKAGTSSDTITFSTSKDLFDRFWDAKQAAVRERLGHEPEWTAVIETLSDHLSDTQQLSAPLPVLDEMTHDAAAMASEFVLTRDDSRWGFFHEAFFDYAFARTFIRRKRRLIDLILGSTQHLFRRAQVRQVLIHEREAAFAHYLADLRDLLTTPAVRLHILRAVLGVLAQIEDPTIEEWRLLAPLAEDSASEWSNEIFNVLASSTGWTHLLDEHGILSIWLASKDDKRIDQVVWLLSRAKGKQLDRSAALLAPFINQGPEWRRRLLNVLLCPGIGSSEQFAALLARAVESGLFDDARQTTLMQIFWEAVDDVADAHPERACEAIGAYCSRGIALARKSGSSNPFEGQPPAIPDEQHAPIVLQECAQKAPVAFVHHVLPAMLTVMKATCQGDGPPWHDSVWCFRRTPVYGIDDNLLATMEQALSQIARKTPNDFSQLADVLTRADYETVQYLLVRGFTAAGAALANNGIDFLCDEPIRLQTGDSRDGHSATRSLLQVATRHCSDDRLTRLARVLLAYYPPWEQSKEGYRDRGNAQRYLLEAIDAARRPLDVQYRLDEWARKFGPLRMGLRDARKSSTVRSPIPEAKTAKMTDAHWMRAIAKYSRDSIRFDLEGPVGGVRQLAHLLQGAAKADPSRFAKLLAALPDTATVEYFEAILRGLAESEICDEDVLVAVRRCHALPRHPCGRWITWLLGRTADRRSAADSMQILEYYATQDPDPQPDRWRKETSSEPKGAWDLATSGLNSVRGGAAIALADILHHHPDLLDGARPVLSSLAADPSLAVKAQAVRTLLSALFVEPEYAVNLFLQVCNADEDLILGTPYVEEFLQHATPAHYGKLRPVLERMLASSDEKVVAAGARQTCVASLGVQAARESANACLAGPVLQRTAAAEVYAANVQGAQFRDFCQNKLVTLFRDNDAHVREAASKCFWETRDDQIAEHLELAEQFITTPAFDAHPNNLLRSLSESTTKLPAFTLTVIERYLARASMQPPHHEQAMLMSDASELIVRTYSQTEDEALRTKCLDLIDKLLSARAFRIDKLLELVDR